MDFNPEMASTALIYLGIFAMLGSLGTFMHVNRREPANCTIAMLTLPAGLLMGALFLIVIGSLLT